MARERHSIPRVGIIWYPEFGYSRRITRGIAEYVSRHSPWRLFSSNPNFAEQLPDLNEWKGDGIIGAFETDEIVRQVIRTGLPAVDAGSGLPKMPLPQLTVDDRAVGHAAAEHLLALGFQHFGVLSIQVSYSQRREAAFCERLAEAGFDCDTCRSYRGGVWPTSGSEPDMSVVEWLKQIEKPVGLFATDDDLALRIGTRVQQLNFGIPDDIAIIGADNDEMICELAPVQLSSVEIPYREIGYKAAGLLDGMMRGKPAPKEPVLIRPGSVIERSSTGIAANVDPEVRRAIEYIRQNAYETINVEDVLEKTNLSRRTLENRFREAIGRSPYQEIQRLRIERAKQLLRETALPVTKVASMVGFSNPHHFCIIFRRKTSQTPTAFRRRHLNVED